jgi:pyruvate dehydrogenase E2 component (dihydrolipoamide acetyltransferase)
MEWEAQDEGVIAKILAPAGSKDIPVGTPVAIIVEDAETVSA